MFGGVVVAVGGNSSNEHCDGADANSDDVAGTPVTWNTTTTMNMWVM